jgi:PST family polysaccharide transporter
MLLYNTHGWIHLSIGRPERWFRWGLMEFGCTVTLFLLALHWGPSGIALAWTISYFLLMFPGFWYAGRPIGLGIGPIFAVIWKFFAASVGAGLGTALIVRTVPQFATTVGTSGAFVRMVSISLVFFVLYLGGVIVLHRGLRPLNETAGLIRDLLPERKAESTLPVTLDTQVSQKVSRWSTDAKPQPEFAVAPDKSAIES